VREEKRGSGGGRWRFAVVEFALLERFMVVSKSVFVVEAVVVVGYLEL
jgi:hypothetical protein